jgi:hypothetical protein
VVTDRRLHRVELRGIPTDVWDSARRWFQGLMREFDVIGTTAGDDTVPARLITFVNEARERFSRFGRSDAELDRALEAGTPHLDVQLELPAAAKEAALDLWQLIEEAESYCRSGQLLSVVPDGDVRQFTEWYLHEITRQIDGLDPIPWGSSVDGGSAE